MPRAYRGVRGPNHSVDVKLKPGKQLENFYWMEGPLDDDRGCRITVLHSGQGRQCSHCLRRVNCPTEGNGKACLNLNTPRGKISDYMRYLKEAHNYVSLKMKHKNRLEQEYPALGGKKPGQDGFSHMTEDLEPELEEPHLETVKESEDNSLKVNPDDFDYDEVNNIIQTKV